MWAFVGLALALAGVAVASWRSRTTDEGGYDGEVYGMTAETHRRFAIASLAFAAAFAFLGAFPSVPPVPVLAAYVVVLVLYVSSFARGATGEDE